MACGKRVRLELGVQRAPPYLSQSKVLKKYDAHIEAIGATRGRLTQGVAIKSTVRVFSASGDTQSSGGWCTNYVRDTCVIRDADSPTKLLGGALGDPEQQGAVFAKATTKTSQLHDAITGIPDPATQMALRLACAGVGKISFLLRLSGDKLQAGDLAEVDKLQRLGVAHTLEGDVGDGAWQQALVALAQGGLGIGDAAQLALQAFVSSRIAARPIAKRIFTNLGG